MKIILSRKGFDSENGKIPNPILPDGTLLSLPIPDDKGNNTFLSLHWNETSYYDIIHSLKHKLDIPDKCHLDPDLRKDIRNRLPGWKPAFGQSGSALGHLQNMNVSVGDLFLFFGRFKEKKKKKKGELVFKKVICQRTNFRFSPTLKVADFLTIEKTECLQKMECQKASGICQNVSKKLKSLIIHTLGKRIIFSLRQKVKNLY